MSRRRSRYRFIARDAATGKRLGRATARLVNASRNGNKAVDAWFVGGWWRPFDAGKAVGGPDVIRVTVAVEELAS